MPTPRTTVTLAQLLSDLRRLGISPGSVLAVHASLSSLGYVQGGAETVIAALMEAVGPEGTLVMLHDRFSPPVPLDEADRTAGVTWKVRKLPWSDLQAHTGMGRIADTFAQRPDVARGPQRQHVLVAWGRRAGWLCQGWQSIMDAGGRILMLGVQMDRCSVLHLVEQRVALPPALAQRLYHDLPASILVRYPSDQWAVGVSGGYLDLLKVQRMADQAGLLHHGRVGQAQVLLLDPVPVLALYERLMSQDPEQFVTFPGTE